MKKTLTSIFLFLIVFSFAISSHFFLLKIGNTIVSNCIDIENLINTNIKPSDSDDFEEYWYEVTVKSKNLEKYISNSYVILSLYLNHERIDLILSEAARLVEYAKYKDFNESLATLSYIESYTNNILKEEEISIRNIF